MDGLERNLDPVGVRIDVMLGTTKMPVHQLLRMGRGAVIELDSHESEDVLVLANDIAIARASVHIDGGKIGIAITKMLPRPPEMREAK